MTLAHRARLALPPPRLAARGSVLLLAACGSALLLAACGGGDAPAGDGPEIEAVVARESAAALFAGDRIGAAREELAPLLERDPVDPRDQLRAAIIELGVFDYDAAEPFLRAAVAALPEDPAAHFNLARLLYDWGNFEEALPHFERAHELAPGDYPTQLRLAQVLFDLGDEEGDDAQLDRAIGLYEDLHARGIEYGGSWHLPTLYQLSKNYQLVGRSERAAEALDEWNRYIARGIPAPSPRELQRGNLGVLHPERVPGRPTAPEAPTLADARTAPWPAGARRVSLARPYTLAHSVTASELGLPTIQGGPPPESYVMEGWIDPGSVLVEDANGIALYAGPDEELVRGSAVVEGAVDVWCLLDLGEDQDALVEFEGDGYVKGPEQAEDGSTIPGGVRPSDLEVVFARGATLSLAVRGNDGAWSVVEEPIAELPDAPTQLVPCDVDHDGDLDLVAVGPFGARLLRHDGADLLAPALPSSVGRRQGTGPPLAGAFVEDTAQLGAPAGRAFAWVVPEDYDMDGDVDLLFGGPDGVFLADSERGGRWADGTARFPEGVDWTHEPAVADLDADRFPDLYLPDQSLLLANRYGDAFERRATLAGEPGALSLDDLDRDGAGDVLLGAGTDAVRGLLALGLVDPPGEFAADLGPPATVGPLDDDGVPEVLGATRIASLASGHSGVTIALKGIKDNDRGVGAIVEVRAGPLYRRIYWRGFEQVVGIGDRYQADVIRVTWPNGVVQSLLDVPRNSVRVFEQVPGLVGSCPFLYTWNGETYEFVSDVLGITPLGLPMAPGMLVPPDHDEYVLVRAEQLRERDGSYDLQITEELREVTYLDRVRLDVVDHPATSEVFPNERFSFPPFPEPHLHTVESTAPLLSARGSDGRDWAPELRAEDGALAAPFDAYRGQYLGLATPHTLELAFDPGAIPESGPLRLVLAGWFYWTDSSVNVAAARHPGREFVPPILQVPDGAGGWRDAGPPIGFPAGKTKTMVVDVADVIDRADPRIRVFSTLRLYWDSIRLATCGDDGELRVTPVELASAGLWERGFSAPVMVGPEHDLAWFDWGTVGAPRWNQHPGQYTRLGDVLPLLGEIDDEFVILGSGDALHLRFPATDLPPLPDGWRRDFVLFLDGWAKDRDPNTIEALFVEPLPFHGMSGYPYGPDEAYPDTPATRAYRTEWNTRPAKRWIEPLEPTVTAGP